MFVEVNGIAEVAIGAAAVGLAAGGCAYAALWPGSQVFGQAMIAPRLDSGRAGEIALTFDDGPNPEWTLRLLDVLERFGVKATFFLVGKYASAEPALTRYIANAGHVVGNHSWSHPNLALTAPGKVREELRTTKDALEQIIGGPVKHFRPPFGARRPDVLRAARELGMVPVLWNAMTGDWSEPDSAKIAAALGGKVERLAARGVAANVVLHDGGHLEPRANRGPSVRAAGALLERFAKEKKFVTVGEWE
jgi:peptidoglycan/xylan/chitin deacetylase (PgdA/CDA1 family)